MLNGLDSVSQWLDPSLFKAEIEKALSTATGSGALFDNVRDRVIAEELDKRHILWANLRKPDGQGAAYLFSRKTARPTAQYVAEDGQAAASDGTYATESVSYVVLSAKGGVTTLLQKAGVPFINALTQAMKDQQDSWADQAEDGIVNGDGTGNTPTGLNDLMDAVPTQQIIAGTPDGGPMTLALLDQAIDLAKTKGAIVNKGVTSDRVRRELNGLLQAQQRFVDKVTVKGGFRVLEYDGIPVLDSKAVVDETYGSSTDAHRFSFIDDEDGFFLAVLMPPTPYPLAITKASVQEFEYLGFFAVVLKTRTRVSQLVAITPP